MSPLTVLTSAPEHIAHWLFACIPFVTVANGKTRINPAQIVQFLIVAGVGGLVAGYIATTKQGVEIEVIKQSIIKIERTVEQGFRDIRKDFYIPNVPKNGG